MILNKACVNSCKAWHVCFCTAWLPSHFIIALKIRSTCAAAAAQGTGSGNARQRQRLTEVANVFSTESAYLHGRRQEQGHGQAAAHGTRRCKGVRTGSALAIDVIRIGGGGRGSEEVSRSAAPCTCASRAEHWQGRALWREWREERRGVGEGAHLITTATTSPPSASSPITTHTSPV